MRKGFTLIELMIAMSIFVVFSTALLEALSGTSKFSENIAMRSDLHATAQRIVLKLADDLSSAQIIDMSTTYDSVTYQRVMTVNPLTYDFIVNESYTNLSGMYLIADKFNGSLTGLDMPTTVNKNDLKGFFVVRNGNTCVIGVSLFYDGASAPINVSFTTEIILRGAINPPAPSAGGN